MYDAHTKYDSFPFLFLFFQVFSYAYGGLHRWSPHGEKVAKVGFSSQRKLKKKVTEKVQVFSYAYGGLHRWSPHGEKAAKIGFGSPRKQKKKVTKKRVKDRGCLVSVFEQ